MIGKTLSHFRIVARLGEGGMGVVYKAMDEKLHRPVALKTLPQAAVSDESRRTRLLREARSAASLSHPNIATIHEVDEADGVIFIAMEYIEGRTLRALLGRAPLTIREVVRIGAEIAEGLAEAHRARVVHRDLKPENVMVTDGGHVKILDFGLAKMLEREPGDGAVSALETVSGERTKQGEILGTTAYLSPEQARGRSVDSRSDLFSFGTLIYEMSTGKTPFQGPTPMDTLSAILTQPYLPARRLTAGVPGELERIMAKCLEKDPAERYQDTRDLVVDLRRLKREMDSSAQAAGQPPTSSAPLPRKGRRALLGGGVAVGLVALTWLGWSLRPKSPAPPKELKQQLILTDRGGEVESEPTLSPDGKYLVVVDNSGVAVRFLATGEARRFTLPEGQTARFAYWSHDGSMLQVTSDDAEGKYSIWSVHVVTGTVRLLRGNALGGIASPDGSLLLFITLGADGQEIYVMEPQGSSARRLTAAREGEGFRGLDWSPDSRRIVYQRYSLAGKSYDVRIETQSLQGEPPTLVFSDPRLAIPGGGPAETTWLADGRLLFSLSEPPPNLFDTNLWALRLDGGTGKPSGPPERVTNWAGSQVHSLRSTADGKRLLLGKIQSQSDVYVAEIEQEGSRLKPPRRVTLDDHNDWLSGWMPDSRRLIFSSDRNGTPDIFLQDLEGGEATMLIGGPDLEMDSVPLPQGTSLLYERVPAAAGMTASERTLLRLDIAGGEPQPLLVVKFKSQFRCPKVPTSSCLLSEVTEKEIVFHALDPIKGKGDVVARSELSLGAIPCWALSADGSRIALVPGETVSNEIRIIDLRGAETRKIVLPEWTNLQAVSWSSDAAFLFLTDFDAGKTTLLRVDLNGRARVLLEPQGSRAWIGRLFPSPDGRYLAYGSREYLRTFWILEGF